MPSPRSASPIVYSTVARRSRLSGSFASAHGAMASTYRFTVPISSQIAASARWKANSSIAWLTPATARSRPSRTAVSSGAAGPGSGHRTAAEVHDHRRGAAREIAQVIGEVGVEPPHEGLLAEARVEAEIHLPEQEVPEGVVAVLVGERERLDDIAHGLRHLPAPERPVAVHVEAMVERDPGGLQHGRPVDAVRLEDILADQVLRVIGRPQVSIERAVRIADGGDVVDEGVEPDIGHVLVVEGQRDAPLKPRPGAADRQVLQGLAQEPQHLVPVALRLDEVRMLLEVLDQPVLVLRHPKEVVLLLDEGERGLVVGAVAVDDLLVGVEPLAAEIPVSDPRDRDPRAGVP